MKNKFNRHYRANIETAIALICVHILMLTVPLYRWFVDGKFPFMGFLQFGIIAPLIIYFMYFGCLFFVVFQTVIINSHGIEICLFKKCIKKYSWNKISNIEETWFMGGPALKIIPVNDDEFHLEKRKAIIQAIEFYSNKRVDET